MEALRHVSSDEGATMELRHVPFCFLAVGALALVAAFVVMPTPSPELATIAGSETAELSRDISFGE